MIIGIRDWKVEDLLDNHGCPANTIYSTTIIVNNLCFYAQFSYFSCDICIFYNNRLVTIIPNKITDTVIADKLIVETFQNNPILRYLVERNRKS